MKRGTITFISAVILLGFTNCNRSKDQSYQFGVVAPFTGQEGAPVYGQNIRNAIELAVGEINNRGGVKGKKFAPIYEDDQLQSSTAVAAVQKLVSVDRVSVIIGPVASSSTKAAADVASQNHVILISAASTSHELSGISPYVFRTIAPDTYEGEAMAQFALGKKYRKFGVAFVDNAGTRGPAEIFRKAVEDKGAKVSAFEVVPQGSTDTRIQMTKLARTRPDAVYLLGYALELGSMIRQFREQAPNIPILSFQVMEEPKVREIAGAAAEGVIFTSPTIYGDFATGRQKEFIDKYRARYGKEPGIFAANAYDAIYVLSSVIEQNGFDVEAIRKGLGEVRGFDGASGKFDINTQGDSNQQPRLMIIHDGKVMPLPQQ